MYLSTQTTAILMAYLSSQAVALPAGKNANGPHVCETLKPMDPVCWNQLAEDHYLKNFTQDSYSPTGPHPWALCKLNEPWSTCFLRDTYHRSEQDCSSLNSTTCTEPPAAIGKLPVQVQGHYGAYSIWAIHHYFQAWSQAISVIAAQKPAVLGTAGQLARSNGPDLIETPDAGIPIDQPLTNLIIQYPSDLQSQAFERVLNQAASNQTYGGYDTVPVLAGLLQRRLQSVLTAVSTNLTLFLDMAANGTFATANTTNSVDIVANLCPGGACGTASID